MDRDITEHLAAGFVAGYERGLPDFLGAALALLAAAVVLDRDGRTVLVDDAAVAVGRDACDDGSLADGLAEDCKADGCHTHTNSNLCGRNCYLIVMALSRNRVSAATVLHVFTGPHDPSGRTK